jgi:hypothetical protein
VNLRSFFLRPHDGSACGGGFCRHDTKCTSNCEGHPRNTAGNDSQPAEVTPDYPWQWVDDLIYAARWVGAFLALALALAMSAGALINR